MYLYTSIMCIFIHTCASKSTEWTWKNMKFCIQWTWAYAHGHRIVKYTGLWWVLSQLFFSIILLLIFFPLSLNFYFTLIVLKEDLIIFLKKPYLSTSSPDSDPYGLTMHFDIWPEPLMVIVVYFPAYGREAWWVYLTVYPQPRCSGRHPGPWSHDRKPSHAWLAVNCHVAHSHVHREGGQLSSLCPNPRPPLIHCGILRAEYLSVLQTSSVTLRTRSDITERAWTHPRPALYPILRS